MIIKQVEVSVKGKTVQLGSISVGNNDIIVSGRLLKIASIKGEGWLEDGHVSDPMAIINKIKKAKAGVDMLIFGQMVPDCRPRFNYYMEWDNFAVLPISSFDYWWKKQVNDKTRNMVRRAQKKGVQVKVSALDEAFVKGIAKIYNETPFRQGKKFWHFGKDIDTIYRDNSSFLERSEFIGAYSGQELIGFIKLVYMNEVAGIMQILSMIKERDKAPNNALVAKAVELCSGRGIKHLIYSKYTYGNKGVDPLADFKRHNAFQEMRVPRYYVPLSIKGYIGLKLKLHHELNQLLPKRVLDLLRKKRENWYRRKLERYRE
jgi:hypothetical protein